MSHLTILDRLIDPLTRCLTPEVAGRIAAARASDEDQRRIDELADKSSAGTLSAEERAEYEAWVRGINVLGVLQAKARRMSAPPTSQ